MESRFARRRSGIFSRGVSERLTTSSDPRVRERFLVGLPCPRCHGVRAEDVLRKFPGLKHYPRVPATLFHHAIQWSRPLLAASLAKRGRDTFLVCSTEHDVDAIQRLLGVSFRAVLRVDRFRAHENPGVFDEWAHEIGWGRRATNSDSASPTMLFPLWNHGPVLGRTSVRVRTRQPHTLLG